MDPIQALIIITSILVVGFVITVRLLWDRVGPVPAVKRAVEELQEVAQYDYLTGLLSGRHLETVALPEAMRRNYSTTDHRPFVLLLVGLDGLAPDSRFQDFDASDEILCDGAKAIRGAIRRSRDQVFRMNRRGGSFAVLLHKVDSEWAKGCAIGVQMALQAAGVTAAISVLGSDRLAEKLSPASFMHLARALLLEARNSGRGIIFGKAATGEHVRLYPPALPVQTEAGASA